MGNLQVRAKPTMSIQNYADLKPDIIRQTGSLAKDHDWWIQQYHLHVIFEPWNPAMHVFHGQRLLDAVLMGHTFSRHEVSDQVCILAGW